MKLKNAHPVYLWVVYVIVLKLFAAARYEGKTLVNTPPLLFSYAQAEKPEDWEEEEDGEWEPAMIKNPEFKGKWKPKMIPNPDYKGPWEHPMVPNPDYEEDKTLGKRCTECTHVGFELWQV